MVEICDNGVDDTGNGLVDCADPECDGFVDGACDTGEPGICAAGTFVCQDLGQVCVQDQQPGTEGPFGSPTCNDGLDNDCDGLTDAADPDCAAPVADVFLSRLQVPNKLNVKPGQVVSRKATVRGDGTLLTQDVTVTYRYGLSGHRGGGGDARQCHGTGRAGQSRDAVRVHGVRFVQCLGRRDRGVDGYHQCAG